MKAAVYNGPHAIRVVDVSPPEMGEGEVLVKMRACGICGSDLMDWYLKPRAPLILGHEPSGTIAKKGKAVHGFEVGDRVFVHHHVACMTCHYCRRGDFTLCEQFHATNIRPGGFAEYFAVPAPNLQVDTFRISDKMSFETATFIEPVGCCLRAMRKLHVRPDDHVVVVGAGPTGLIHVALSKIFGAAKTIVSDLIDSRLGCAKSLGADVTVHSSKEHLADVVKAETEGRGADAVIVTAPSVEAYKEGLTAVRKGGKLCVFAPTDPDKHLQLSPKELFFTEVQIVPSYSTSHLETRMAYELIEAGRLKVEQLISHRFGLEDAQKAFEVASNSEESLKVIVLNR